MGSLLPPSKSVPTRGRGYEKGQQEMQEASLPEEGALSGYDQELCTWQLA